MREIKFRAWDYTSNVMRNDITEMVFNSDGTLNQIDVETGADILFPEKECVLMQYTGLKDKNGVEIYEGDIVEDNASRYKVIYHMDGFYLHNTYTPEDMLLQLRHGNLLSTVIGNIYENPGLLKALEEV